MDHEVEKSTFEAIPIEGQLTAEEVPAAEGGKGDIVGIKTEDEEEEG